MVHRVLEKFGHDRPILIAVAAPLELKALAKGFAGGDIQMPRTWEAVSIGRFDLLLTGVSKASAAGGVATVLDPRRHAAVLSIGIGGAYPIDPPLALGQTVVATQSIMADEGVQTPETFISCAKLGFPLNDTSGDGVISDPALFDLLEPLGDRSGPVATVSTCSGTDALVEHYRTRTSTIAESMEGAAVGLVAARRSVPFIELRVLSNTTGDRAGQAWDIPGAVRALEALARRL